MHNFVEFAPLNSHVRRSKYVNRYSRLRITIVHGWWQSRARASVCVCVSRHTIWIKFLKRCLHICIWFAYSVHIRKRYCCRNKRSVRVQSEKTRGVTEREICELLYVILACLYTYHTWIGWYTFLFRAQSAWLSQIYTHKASHNFELVLCNIHMYVLVHIYGDIAIIYGKSFNFRLDFALCLFSYF